jgi:hypothetical protein
MCMTNEEALALPLVLVEWLDAIELRGDGPWMPLDQIRSWRHPAVVLSPGFLLRRTKDFLVLSFEMSLDFDCDAWEHRNSTDPQGSHGYAIPLGAVRRVTDLRTGEIVIERELEHWPSEVDSAWPVRRTGWKGRKA